MNVCTYIQVMYVWYSFICRSRFIPSAIFHARRHSQSQSYRCSLVGIGVDSYVIICILKILYKLCMLYLSFIDNEKSIGNLNLCDHFYDLGDENLHYISHSWSISDPSASNDTDTNYLSRPSSHIKSFYRQLFKIVLYRSNMIRC